jgi:hypothetical protein
MLSAHLNHYINITQPIHPVAEELILRYTSISEKLKFASASPQTSPEGELLYNSAEWIMQLKDCILPRATNAQKVSTPTADDRIAQWMKLNNKDNHGR